MASVRHPEREQSSGAAERGARIDLPPRRTYVARPVSEAGIRVAPPSTYQPENRPIAGSPSLMSEPASPAQLAVVDEARAWPFEEARRIVERLKKLKGGMDKTVLFETGYGPSGLPHIGTFGEVARTTMVRRAFEALTDGQVKTRLALLLRRHGRHAQGARQRAQPGDAARPTCTSR